MSRWVLLGWVGIALLALGLRFVALTRLPHTLWVDEAWFGLRGAEVLSGQDWLPLAVPDTLGVGVSPFQIYAAAIAQGLGVPAAYSSRAASAVAGLLAVMALFPTASLLLAPLLPKARVGVAALLSMLVLAGLFASLHYSRDGGQNSACVLATIVTLAATYLAYERRSRAWAIGAGASLGVALTTYEAALALPLIILAFAGLRLWQSPETRRSTLRLAALGVLSALVVFGPFLLYYLRHPEIYLLHLWHTQAVAQGTPASAVLRLVQGLGAVLGGIALRGDMLPGRNLVGRPLFDALTSLLLGLGLARLWGPVRRVPAAQLLALWIGIMVLPASVTNEPPAFPRMLPMTPALALCAGLGGAWLWDWAARRGAWWGRAALAGAVGLALVGVAVSARDYFVVWNQDPRLFDARAAGPRRTADIALALAATDRVLITVASDPFVQGPFELLFAGTDVAAFDRPADCFPFANKAATNTAYGVITVIDFDSLPQLHQAYPLGREVGAVLHPGGYAYSVFFQVPAGMPAPAPQTPLFVQFEGGLALTGLTVLSTPQIGERLSLNLHWSAEGPLAEALTGFIHVGRGRNSEPLIGQHDGPLCSELPLSLWQPGFSYVERRSFVLTGGDPGAYDIRVGVYRTASGLRHNILTADVPVEDNRAVLLSLDVP